MPRPTDSNSSCNEIASCSTPSFNLPPHLLGRNVENPTSDTTTPGRRLQKPRPGVRVPYRNLTSQIVTHEEIAQEILERSLKRNSRSQTASPITGSHHDATGESVFAMRLSRRLANRLSSSSQVLDTTSNGNPEKVWSKMPVNADGEKTTVVSVRHTEINVQQFYKEPSGETNGEITSPHLTSSLCPPRLNRSITKLDKDTEREMALKQLSELPLIKGPSRDLTCDGSALTPRKRTLSHSDTNLNSNLVLRDPLNFAKHSDKPDVPKHSLNVNLVSSPLKLESTCPLTKIASESCSSLPESVDNVILPHNDCNILAESCEIVPGKIKLEDGGSVHKTAEVEKVSKTEADSSNMSKSLKASAHNGRVKKNMRGGRRSSARLNAAQLKVELSSQILSKYKRNASARILRRKDIPRKQNRKTLPRRKLLGSSSLSKTESKMAVKLNRSLSSNDSKESLSGLTETLSPSSSQHYTESKSEKKSALAQARNPVVNLSYSNKVILDFFHKKDDSNIGCNSGGNKGMISNESLKEGSQESSMDASKTNKKRKVKMRELEKLLVDEGALNMLMETAPRAKEMMKMRKTNKLSQSKGCNKISSQDIRYKATMFKRLLLRDGMVSRRPKRKTVADKPNRNVMLVDLTHSPAKDRSSTSSEKSSRKSSVAADPKSSGIDRQRSLEETTKPLNASLASTADDCKRSLFRDMIKSEEKLPSTSGSANEKRIVDIEGGNIASMSTSLNQTKQSNLSRFCGARKHVTLPRRMSNAVRMKLKTEMSKNFQRGFIDVENSKLIQTKLTKMKESLAMPFETDQNTTPLNENVIQKVVTNCVKTPSSKQLKSNNLTSPAFKSLNLLKGPELAICVEKLKERNVSVTHVDNNIDQKDAFCADNISNKALYAPSVSVVPKEASPPPLIGTNEVTPKAKKCKESNGVSMKHVISKQHQIVSIPVSPIPANYNSILKSLKNLNGRHKKKTAKLEKQMESKESLRQRFSGRQNAGTYSYKEICLRRYEHFVQIILAPGSTVMKNSLNAQVLNEFRDALQQLRRDRFCRVVLVTSTGSTFCQGIDLYSLMHVNIEHRKKAAEELSKALKDFLKVLGMFNKPIVAGVQGPAVGLGVTMLPFFDVVYASDKATFHTPYARLGQVPEGAAVLTLPLLLGNTLTSEMLFGCKRLTAVEARQYGLVTRILWPDKFQEQLIPYVKDMANQSSQSMESMKALLRLNLRLKLDATLENETALLVQHWCSPECQRNFRKFLEASDDVSLQRQKKDPC